MTSRTICQNVQKCVFYHVEIQRCVAVLNMSHPISVIGEFIQQGHDLILMLIKSIIIKKVNSSGEV